MIKRFDNLNDRITKLEIKIDKLEFRIDKLEFELTYRLDKLENNNGGHKKYIKRYHYN
jgi:uncharacterized coiled-coil protein SlyX